MKDGCWVVSSECAGHRGICAFMHIHPGLNWEPFLTSQWGAIYISAVHKLGFILSLLSSPKPSSQCQNMRSPQQSTEGMLRMSPKHVGTMSLTGWLAFLRAVHPIHFDISVTRTLYRSLWVFVECGRMRAQVHGIIFLYLTLSGLFGGHQNNPYTVPFLRLQN